MNASLSHANEFQRALQTHAAQYGVRLDEETTKRLSEYYLQVNLWNARLHLVAPCSPAEFATRHILESLFALKYLPENARVADVGSGAGLPLIPCLIARPDLRATLIEASTKKSIFLREALRRVIPLSDTIVVNQRFETIAAPEVGFVTCRALERFTEKFRELVVWSPPGTTLLFFGGPSLGERIEAEKLSFSRAQLPESERRYLFIIERGS